MVNGPGKRGTLNIKNATQSKIFLMKSEEEEKLGYIKLGIPYTIPQLIIKNKKIKIHFPKEETQKLLLLLEKFEKEVNHLDEKRINFIESKNSIIIGYHKEKIYLTQNKLNEIEKLITENKIFEKIKEKVFMGESFGYGAEKVNCKIKLKFNMDFYYRVCAKIALNGACYLLGKEHIFSNDFSEIKKYILGGQENNFVSLTGDNRKGFEDLFKRLNISFNSHAMIFSILDNKLVCILKIYSFYHEVTLGKIYKNIFPVTGLICDWENKREFTLMEYLIKEYKI